MDPYRVLGIERTASFDEVKRAYRRLAQQFHPDKNPSSAAQAKFQDISQAYQAIERHHKRAASYQSVGAEGAGSGSSFYHGSFDGSSFEHSFGDMGPDLRDVFDSLFSQDHPSSDAPSVSQVRVRLPFALAVRGGDIEVKARIPTMCQSCRGSGKNLNHAKACSDCQGHGVRVVVMMGVHFQQRCESCQGHGWVSPLSCQDCQGKGEVGKEQSWKLRIPPFFNSQIVRLQSGSHTVMAHMEVEPHPVYRIEHGELKGTLDVPLPLACLGGVVQTITWTNEPLEVPIHKGTQPGQTFLQRVSLQNHPTPVSVRWDVSIHIPTSLTPEQEKFFQVWKEKDGRAGSKAWWEQVKRAGKS